MIKLLHKPFKAFTAYALIILVLSIPVYYLVIDYIWLSELDEHNLIVKDGIQERFNLMKPEDPELEQVLKIYNTLQPGIKLLPVSSASAQVDSIYTTTAKDERAEGEADRFRCLSSTIIINGIKWKIQVQTNVEEADETILAIASVTILFFILLVAGFIILNRRLGESLWKPFRNSLAKLKAFDLTGGRAVEFEKTEIEEFEELNKSLNKLISKNISVYNQQKRFIENASHELQTPLAVLRSKMNLLLQNESITANQSEILNAIELPLSRISRINKNLLLLAGIENSQFSETTQNDVSEMLREILGILTDYASSRKIDLSIGGNSTLFVSSNRFLLETMIYNLLTNAIRHTKDGSTVSIELNKKAITFRNPGISELRHDGLFERFNVSSADTTSSGLGLAIVREICNLYNWKIEYGFADNSHSFSVRF